MTTDPGRRRRVASSREDVRHRLLGWAAAPARYRTALRAAAAERYRGLLAQRGTGRRLSALRAVAAVLDQALAGLRLLRTLSRPSAARRYLATRSPGRMADAAVVVAAAVGGGSLSLVVSGLPAPVSGLHLIAGDDGPPVVVPATVDDGPDGTARVLGALPAGLFDGGRSYRVRLSDAGASAVDLTAGAHTTQPPTPLAWPPRLWWAQDGLMIAGRSPAVAPVQHTVELRVRSVVLGWPARAGSQLVLHHCDGTTVDVVGRPVEHPADGDAGSADPRLAAEVPLATLTGDTRSADASWSFTVSPPGGPAAPLGVPCGSLLDLQPLLEQRGSASRPSFTLGYDGDGTLRARTGRVDVAGSGGAR